ncbi:MAG TPA: dihydrofolate reductase family protein [Myxococcota bacterium]
MSTLNKAAKKTAKKTPKKSSSSSTLPRVICHMAPSIDGRIVVKRWPGLQALTAIYEAIGAGFDADAWIIGRVSMQAYVDEQQGPPVRLRAPRTPLPRTTYVADAEATSFAIAIDPAGKLRWKHGHIDDEHVITVLSTSVSDAYLAHLRSIGVSYVFGGDDTIQLRRVLRTLKQRFGIETLLLEGGGGINGHFLAADVIDELSVIVAPLVDGSVGTPSLFDASTASTARAPRALKLVAVEPRGDLLWVRYAFTKR